MNIRITDKGGLKPTFTQWDVDRVLLISGCESQPSLHFDNPELSRSIVVVAEADGANWKCNVPNFILQFSGPMIVSVFIQPDEGKTVFTARYAVQWAKKPQDYTYEENIGYTNWVQKAEEAQELLDDIEDLRDEIQTAVDTATSASEAAVAAAEDIDETVAAALQEAKESGDFDGADGQDGQDGAPGPKGDAGEDGVSPTVTVSTITGGHRISISAVNGDYEVDVMDGAPGPQGATGPQGPKGETGAKGDDGQDGQDAVVDATLSHAGEAADAAATGKVKELADAVAEIVWDYSGAVSAADITYLQGKTINSQNNIADNANHSLYHFTAPVTGHYKITASVSSQLTGRVYSSTDMKSSTYVKSASGTIGGYVRTVDVEQGQEVAIAAKSVTFTIDVVYATAYRVGLRSTLPLTEAMQKQAPPEVIKQVQFPGQLAMPISAAHRGLASSGHVDNTIPAYEDAVAKGWTYLETDLRQTSDKVWVLLHGPTIATGVNIADITYAQALEYDLGGGTHIATLEELLILCRRSHAHPILEIKDSTISQTDADALWDMILSYDMADEVFFLCSSFGGVEKFLQKNPRIPCIYTVSSSWTYIAPEDFDDNVPTYSLKYKTGQNKAFIARISSGFSSKADMDNFVDYYHHYGIYAGVYGPTSQSSVDNLCDRLDLAITENVKYEIERSYGGGGGGAVDSVNGKTGVVVLTASEVGAVAVAQGVAHAGEFLVVGSDGNITTVTMTAWSGGSY